MTAPLHRSAANFDRLVRIYRALEYVAFGRDLERVRFCQLDRLRDCASILILGEGDGRFLSRLVQLNRTARIDCVDASPAMLAAASARLPDHARARVTFTCADIFALTFDGRHYDAVVTLFFLDCFSTEQTRTIIERVTPALTPGASWIFGDFVVPDHGWAKLRARLWLAVLYTFFRLETGLKVTELPDSDAALRQAGFTCEASRQWQHGLLRSSAYRRSQ